MATRWYKSRRWQLGENLRLQFRTGGALRSRCIIKKVIECSQQGVDALSPSHFSPVLSLSSSSYEVNQTHQKKKIIPTNFEEVEELNAHNYTSIQTYVSQSQMPSMCEMGVTLLEVSLFAECVSPHFGYRTHWSQWLCYRLPLISSIWLFPHLASDYISSSLILIQNTPLWRAMLITPNKTITITYPVLHPTLLLSCL